MSYKSLIHIEWVRHTIFWCAFLFFLFSTIMSTEPIKTSAIISFTLVGCYLPLVYLNIYVLHRILSEKKYLLYTLFFIVVAVTGGLLLHQLFSAVFEDTRNPVSWILYLTFILLFTSGFKFGYDGFIQYVTIQKMKTKQFEVELNLLKSQINPHFFFNTLNNIHFLAKEENAEKTASCISTLAGIMRYIVYDNNGREISLKKEVEQINRYIELQKLKFSKEDNVLIDFKVHGDTANIGIPSMILIPFIENAFKHGIRLSRPSSIGISLAVLEEEVHFSVKNTFHGKNSDDERQEGVGLNNVKKRLELIFSENYHLDIQIKEGYYIVNLEFR